MPQASDWTDTTAMAIFPFVLVPYQSWLMRTDSKRVDAPVQKLVYRPVPCQLNKYTWQAVEPRQVAWLIRQFNAWFAHHHTVLVRGDSEPEYFAASGDTPAKIVFAHGFFASALHEISHWCVAGRKRRQLNDFGYWYAPDGRSQAQQQAFEQVEIIPQAIECLLTLACGRRFRVSQDNLSADFDTHVSTFPSDVCQQAVTFWQTGDKLPTDAKRLLSQLQPLRPYPMSTATIYHNFLRP